MRPFRLIAALLGAALVAPLPAAYVHAADHFSTDFFPEECSWSNRGANLFYVPLDPGTEYFYEGENEDGEAVELLITVLNRTETINFTDARGNRQRVKARVIREHESANGELVEVSHNWMALCEDTNDVFYFGEDVDIYEDGEIVSHAGAWRAGVNGAQPGILMPGRFLAGSAYYQEIAPGVALDRSEHVEVDLDVEVPAGSFERCGFVLETTPLEPGHESEKIYCPGVGMVTDNTLELAWYRRGRTLRAAGNDRDDD